MNDNMRNILSGSTAGEAVRAKFESERIERELEILKHTQIMEALNEQIRLLKEIAENTHFIREKLNEQTKQSPPANVSNDHT